MDNVLLIVLLIVLIIVLEFIKLLISENKRGKKGYCSLCGDKIKTDDFGNFCSMYCYKGRCE